MYEIGQQVSWRGVNRTYTGKVVGFKGPFAIVSIDGTGKHTLIDNRKPKAK